jgi:hypothetical protein
VQPPFGSVQMPQLGLQHTIPAAQRVDPHAGPSSAKRQLP